jgi:hypothetical protein
MPAFAGKADITHGRHSQTCFVSFMQSGLHAAASAKGPLISSLMRCTVPVPTPILRAVMLIPTPAGEPQNYNG